MMEERYHATTQNRFYPDMSNVNKNITVGGKTYQPTYVRILESHNIPNSVPHCNSSSVRIYITVKLLMCLIKHTFFLRLTLHT